MLHLELVWVGWLPRIRVNTERHKDELETEQFDASAMRYLGLVGGGGMKGSRI